MSITATLFATGLTNIRTANLSQNLTYLSDTNDSLNRSQSNSSITQFINDLPKIHNKSNINYSKRLVRTSHDSKSFIPSKYHLLFSNATINDTETSDSPVPNTTFSSSETIDLFEKTNENPITVTFLIIILVLWNIFGFFIQIKILFFTESKEATNQFLDNCTIKTSYFKYMVRLKYSDLVGGYQLATSTIMIDLFDTKDRFITRFTIPPAWFLNEIKTKNKNNKLVKFRFNRRFEFPEIGSMK